MFFTAFDMIKFSKNLPQPPSHLTQVLAEKLTHIHTKQQTLLHTISTSLWTKEGMSNDFPYLNLMHWNVFIEQKA